MRRRGITQVQLAEKCGVTRQYISSIEREAESPTSEMIERIANELNFPVDFFYEPAVELIPVGAPTFRAQRKMTSAVRDMGLGGSDIAAGIIAADLQKRFTLPVIDMPDFSDFTDQPEAAADLLRARWNLGYEPIKHMVQLLESKGVGVYWLSIDNPALDAISFWYKSRPFVMLNSHKEAGERGRFDAAHELGHLVLHQHDTSNLDNKEDDEYVDNKEIESQANRFASAFLLPRATFELECPRTPDFNELYQLKVKWRVAIQAMIMRGHMLGLFSDWQKQQAFQKLQISGEKKREQVHIPREESMLHIKIFERLLQKGIPPEQYAALLRLTLGDIEELMPTVKRYLASDDNKIIRLDRRRAQSARQAS